MSIDEIIAVVQGALANPVFIKYGFYGLFASSFLSATAIPFPSELTAFALIAAGDDKFVISLVMAAGWTGGGILGYYLGRSGNKLFNFLRLKKNKDNSKQVDKVDKSLINHDKADGILRKYGWAAIFGSAWIPFVGDFIPIVAGTKKYDLRLFLASLAGGKLVKAFVVVYFGTYLFGKLFVN